MSDLVSGYEQILGISSRAEVLKQMQKDMEYVEHLADGIGMDVDTFAYAQDRDGIFFRTGVDSKRYKELQNLGITGIIPVFIDKRSYDINMTDGTMETDDVPLVTSEGSERFKGVIKTMEEKLINRLSAMEHTDNLIEAMQLLDYHYSDIDSSDYSLVFNYPGGGNLRFPSWPEVREWLTGLVIDDPEISDKVEELLTSEYQKGEKMEITTPTTETINQDTQRGEERMSVEPDMYDSRIDVRISEYRSEDEVKHVDFAKNVTTQAQFPERVEGIEIRQASKANEPDLIGVTLKLKDLSVGPTFYVNDIYKDWMSGQLTYSEAVDRVKDLADRGMSHLDEFEFDASVVTDFSQAKDRLVPILINAGRNAELLENLPHKTIGDIALIFAVDVTDMMPENPGRASIKVTEGIMQGWGADVDMLDVYARENSHAEVQSLGAMLAAMMGAPMEMTVGFPAPGIAVVTSESHTSGAGMIMDKDIVDKISDALGSACDDGYYVLPSSVHELLVVPKDIGSIAELKDLVMSVNGDTSLVSATDYLSDSVLFLGTDGRLSVAVEQGQTQSQDQKQDRHMGRPHDMTIGFDR